ncbi:efflux RND transporter periplasmic adaptor subunit [Coralloluteibacterium stylophorae]|uniref:Efflux RND transporter periplasmic adaptor subunit n=1 Tax=Coralloluteibacterium stylophorae TaxID=1776034 RepID=A0AAP2C8T5_9GAMM|nr:efflux RND transporter periplasmic adaptor subunit [Coralloluteibacterium stylophorae]MBS7455989.1 efflux RND transporter periplasmic adaptor subunit [Coralloluteibacterium stylophorae]
MNAHALPLRRAALVLAGVLLLSACGGSDEKAADAASETPAAGAEAPAAQPEAVPVETARAAEREIAASYTTTAALEAPGEAQVVAKTSGVLLELMAEEGDRVKRGQVLARIDPDRPRLEVARTEAAMRKLEANYARSQQLADKRLVSADANEQLRYDLASARAAWEMAKLELSYTQIEAPIDGVIAQRMVKRGNLIQLNSALFRIVDDSRLDAVLNVPERELAILEPGQTVLLRADALPGEVFEGKVDRISPVIDAGSGTFRVTCAFDAGQALRPGMFGRVEVIYDRRDDVLTIPRSALLEEGGEPAVFVVRDGKAVRTPVEIGHSGSDYVEVRSGVEAGASVVTAGKLAIRDGAAVETLPMDDGARTAAATPSAEGNGGGAVRQ